MFNWQWQTYQVNLEYSDKLHPYEGKVYLKYKFYDHDYVHFPIFEGEVFSPSPVIEPLSVDSVIGLLGFLPLQEGDTDEEYFDNYTELQLYWSQGNNCEELACLVADYQNDKEEAIKEWGL